MERPDDFDDPLFDPSSSWTKDTLLLASGSADPFVYVYAMTLAPSVAPVTHSTISATSPTDQNPSPVSPPGTSVHTSGNQLSTIALNAGPTTTSSSSSAAASSSNSSAATGTWELVQKLSGHTDRVYAVDFHPLEPSLASCSADFGIKVWSTRRRDAP